ncbi:5-formyltetrahydrofolate cyclo-ligase [Diplocarpon rosae]|nr:5-formyltetrahydrofolate cyclo-ligase [Diplocarpon rosae]
MTLSLKTAKRELRSVMKKKLAGIHPESVEAQSTIIFHNVTSYKPYLEAKRISVYLSMPTGEVQTDAIVRHALKSGKQVFVPYIHKLLPLTPDTPRSVMDMVDLRSLSEYESLERDGWGIPTVDADTVDQRDYVPNNSKKETEALDLILMPGVAFDVDPNTGFVRRLGHGKGFYDYFLHRYMQSRGSNVRETTTPGTDVLLCGLAFHEQFLVSETGSSVPVGDHDNLLHSLMVGDGKLWEGPRRK